MPSIRAPEFPPHYPWLNCDRPLTLASLRGRIVLLDFWTYGCINCLHILPDLRYLEHKYPDRLTILGIHSAKFEHEKEIANIRQAILRYDIEHPVLVDSGFRVWQQYAIRAWPTLVLIDPKGYVVGTVSGEGKRNVLDESIGQLIHQHQEPGTIAPLQLSLEKHRQPLLTPLAFPGKVLADAASDRLFIADSGHHRLVVCTLSGEVLDLIGTGTPGLRDGSFSEAQFFSPQGMTLDPTGKMLDVADTENHSLRQVDLVTQQVRTIAGTGIQSRHIYPHGGKALETPLNSPWDLEWVGDRLYIAMAGSHQIWMMDLATQTIQTYVGTGAEAGVDGGVTEAAFAQPSGITSHGEELFIADSEISSIRGVGLAPKITVRTICGRGALFDYGDVDGQGWEVRLQHCLGIHYAFNSLWVADTYNHKIKQVDPETGSCKTLLGGHSGCQDDIGMQAQFAEPSGVSTTPSHLYIADTNNHAIRRVDRATLEVQTLSFPGLCSPSVCFPR